jgi:hypothetical protein
LVIIARRNQKLGNFWDSSQREQEKFWIDQGCRDMNKETKGRMAQRPGSAWMIFAGMSKTMARARFSPRGKSQPGTISKGIFFRQFPPQFFYVR